MADEVSVALFRVARVLMLNGAVGESWYEFVMDSMTPLSLVLDITFLSNAHVDTINVALARPDNVALDPHHYSLLVWYMVG
jgi:hypothetical protein